MFAEWVEFGCNDDDKYVFLWIICYIWYGFTYIPLLITIYFILLVSLVYWDAILTSLWIFPLSPLPFYSLNIYILILISHCHNVTVLTIRPIVLSTRSLPFHHYLGYIFLSYRIRELLAISLSTLWMCYWN